MTKTRTGAGIPIPRSWWPAPDAGLESRAPATTELPDPEKNRSPGERDRPEWTDGRRIERLQSMIGYRISGPRITLFLLFLIALTPGCGLLRAPEKVVTAVTKSKQPDPLDLQLQLQRYTDDYLARADEALDEYAHEVGTESAQIQAMRFKLIGGSSVVGIVSGPNPNVNLLDLVSVTVLTRKTIEDYWIKTTNGPAFRPWLEVSRVLETNVWLVAGRALQTNQVEELRKGIDLWYARTPETRTAFFARPHEFGSMVRTENEKNAGAGSVFSLVSLDPTAGLDPAVREVTRTRLFAERAMFTMQRMPFLLRLQTELLAYELAEQPAVQTALTNTARIGDSAERISRAADSVSATAAQLPDRLSAERKAIVDAMGEQEGKLKELAAAVDRSLVSGEKMSSSLSITITNLDALMKRFGVGEPSTNATPDTNSPPFNILDYAKTADQIGGMAKDINTLIASVNQSVPQLTRLSQQASADAQSVVNHSFRLGLVLIVVLLAGAVVAALAYRVLANKLVPTRRPPSSSNLP